MSQLKNLVQQGFNSSISSSIDRAINERATIPNNRTIKKDLHQKQLTFKTK